MKQKPKPMTTQKFNLKNFLTENREVVISEFNKLQEEKFYNGISLRDFMISLLNTMRNNNIRSEKIANRDFNSYLGMVYSNNINIGVTYSKPYSESNHAKMVNYYGKEKAEQLMNL